MVLWELCKGHGMPRGVRNVRLRCAVVGWTEVRVSLCFQKTMRGKYEVQKSQAAVLQRLGREGEGRTVYQRQL